MRRVMIIYFNIISLLLVTGAVGAQTFTYAPSNGGCDGTWEDADCWTVSATSGCTANSAPPSTNTTGCEVNIIINDDVSYNTGGDYMVFGGSFNRLSVENGATLTIVGDVEINSEDIITFYADNGGEIDIQGELMLSLGTNSNNTTLRIDGDGSSYVYTELIDLRGRATIEVMEGGSLVSHGPTNYNGNSSRIDVHGFFRTSKVDIQGGSNHQLNSFGSAQIVVEGDIVLGGTTDITFNGDSEVDVGGDIINNGAAIIRATDNAKVYYCGIIWEEPDAEEIDAGEFRHDCRLLPIQWGGFQADFISEGQVVNVDWSTVKESETSHFEIERSVDGADGFERVGMVNASGWSDRLVKYNFKDTSLPLSVDKVYYRVKLVDLMGEETYTEVVRVDLPKASVSTDTWRAYPNPTNGEEVKIALLNSELYRGGEISFRIFDSLKASAPVTVNNAHELNPMVGEVVRRFSSGLVILELTWGNHVEYKKIIIQ